MEEIKKDIFKLIEKRPTYIEEGFFDCDFASCNYSIGETEINIKLFTDAFGETNKKSVMLSVRNGQQFCHKEVDLTEKEYMQLKWKIQDWNSILKEELMAVFKEFVNTPNGTMEDLLND